MSRIADQSTSSRTITTGIASELADSQNCKSFYQVNLNLYKQRMTQRFYNIETGKFKAFGDERAWYEYAGRRNFKAAYEFDCLAEVLGELQGPHDNDRTPVLDTGIFRPTYYLLKYQHSVVRRWTDTLKEWEREKQANPRNANVMIWKLELDIFRVANHTLQSRLPMLDEAMTQQEHDPEDYNTEDHEAAAEEVVETDSAWRGMRNLAPKLAKIEEALTKFIEDFEQLNNTRGPMQQSGMRRRRPGSRAPEVQDSEDNGNQVPAISSSSDNILKSLLLWISTASWIQSLLLTYLPAFSFPSDFPFPSSKSILWFAIDQSTLWFFSLLFTGISGLMIGFAIMQPRPPECVPASDSRDDNFWALLSQLFIQLLSLYCTIVPLIRDRSLPVRRFWFSVTLGVSAATTVVAPVVYGYSWKASALASYVSGVAALMASAQLAGGVQQVVVRMDLGHRRAANR